MPEMSQEDFERYAAEHGGMLAICHCGKRMAANDLPDHMASCRNEARPLTCAEREKALLDLAALYDRMRK